MNIINPNEILSKLNSNWQLSENNDLLSRRFELNNFVEALDIVNKIGDLAEQQQHHPDINLGWGYVEVYLSTHDIGGISDKDIILAQKIDKL
ncbi:MAG: 4a-hydroxytetrahydrobiopterin dehydratase [Candidatus Paceibacterota bacterium]